MSGIRSTDSSQIEDRRLQGTGSRAYSQKKRKRLLSTSQTRIIGPRSPEGRKMVALQQWHDEAKNKHYGKAKGLTP